MRILLTNDDGIKSIGLQLLADYLFKKGHEIYICAPNGQRSGFSHSMSFYKDMTYNEVEYRGATAIEFSGTPADCVRFGLYYFSKQFDIVISGINLGQNIGNDIVYSGTVSGCLEANLTGHKAIAISTTYIENNFENNNKFLDIIYENIFNYISNEYTININFPNCLVDKCKGIKVCEIGNRPYNDVYVKTGNKTYQLQGFPIERDGIYDDDYYLVNNYITVTIVEPISNNNKLIDKLKGLEK